MDRVAGLLDDDDDAELLVSSPDWLLEDVLSVDVLLEWLLTEEVLELDELLSVLVDVLLLDESVLSVDSLDNVDVLLLLSLDTVLVLLVLRLEVDELLCEDVELDDMLEVLRLLLLDSSSTAVRTITAEHP